MLLLVLEYTKTRGVWGELDSGGEMDTREICLFRDIRPKMFKWTTFTVTREHGSIEKIYVGRENLVKNVKVCCSSLLTCSTTIFPLTFIRFFTVQKVFQIIWVFKVLIRKLYIVSTPFVNSSYAIFALEYAIIISRSPWGEMDILKMGCPFHPNPLVLLW